MSSSSSNGSSAFKIVVINDYSDALSLVGASLTETADRLGKSVDLKLYASVTDDARDSITSADLVLVDMSAVCPSFFFGSFDRALKSFMDLINTRRSAMWLIYSALDLYARDIVDSLRGLDEQDPPAVKALRWEQSIVALANQVLTYVP